MNGVDIIEPAGLPYSSGCYDCDQLTSRRCWRHASTTYIIPVITIVPEVVTVPLLPAT